MADLLEDMNEIQEIMGRSYGCVSCPECQSVSMLIDKQCDSHDCTLDRSIGADVDESELEAELAGLEEEWAEEEAEAAAEAAPSYLAPAQPQHSLPTAPSGALPASSARRTDEFGLPIAS